MINELNHQKKKQEVQIVTYDQRIQEKQSQLRVKKKEGLRETISN
jgi:hypothetical protein